MVPSMPSVSAFAKPQLPLAGSILFGLGGQ
jgi:hypothetical protein